MLDVSSSFRYLGAAWAIHKGATGLDANAVHAKRRHHCCRFLRRQDLRDNVDGQPKQRQRIFESGKITPQCFYCSLAVPCPWSVWILACAPVPGCWKAIKCPMFCTITRGLTRWSPSAPYACPEIGSLTVVTNAKIVSISALVFAQLIHQGT